MTTSREFYLEFLLETSLLSRSYLSTLLLFSTITLLFHLSNQPTTIGTPIEVVFTTIFLRLRTLIFSYIYHMPPKRKKNNRENGVNQPPSKQIKRTRTDTVDFQAILGLDRPSNQSSIQVENSIMDALEVRGSNLHPERDIINLLNPELPAQVLHLIDTVGEEVLEEHKKNLDPSWPVPLYTTTINSCQNICLLELSFTKPNLLTQLCTETNRLKELLNHVNNSNKRQKRNVGVYDEVMNIQTNTPKTQYNAHLFNSRQILQQNRICGSCSKRVLQCTHYEWLNAADKEDHTEKE
jgi:hypothetical protein